MTRLQRASASLSAALLILLLGNTRLTGQSLSSGSLQGTVVELEGEPVSANVVLHDVASGVLRRTSSGRDGQFSFGTVPRGEYTLRVEEFGFRPTLVTGIQVQPGEQVNVPVVLAAVSGVATTVDTVAFRGAVLGGTGPRLAERVPTEQLRELPTRTRNLAEIGRLASTADADGSMQGLPAAFSGFQVDGSRVYTLHSPALVPGSYRSAALPIDFFEQGAVVSTNPDVEWSGFTGGALEGYTRRPPLHTGVIAYADWAGSSLRNGYSGPDAGTYQSVRGGFELGVPIVPSSAGLLLGVDVRHLVAPSRQPWLLSDTTASVIEIARDSFGVDLTTPTARLRQSDLVSAYGLLDWQVSSASHLDVRVSGAFLPYGDGMLRLPPNRGALLPFHGRDLSTALLLSTRLSSRAVQELRAGWDENERDYSSADTLGLVGETDIVAGDLNLSSYGTLPSSFQQSVAHASETLLLSYAKHQVKLGASIARTGTQAEPGTSAEFLFSDLDAFASGQGYYRTLQAGAAAGQSFSLLSGALYAQDSWNAAPGLQILAGLRLDAEQLPTGEVQADTIWRTLTGLDNTNVHSAWLRLNPRFGFSWSPNAQQVWMLSGSAGLYSGTADPLLLSAWVDGPSIGSVRQGFGSLQGWPALPDSSGFASAGRSLFLLHPDYAPPRTARATLGITRALGNSARIRLEGLYRRTDVLPRLSDLNLAPDPAARDQNGRVIYGALEQHGSIVTATTGTNRRFAGFDRVLSANLDGWSTYWGATLSVQEHASRVLDLFGSYTYSHTRDNWVATSGSGLEPSVVSTPAGVGTEWMIGTSNFDVPHRLALGAILTFEQLGGLQLSGLYRYRSGIPFTPGFGSGLDINGNGVTGDDPAFVDAQVPGTDALISRWSCLKGQVGEFATRNSCRTEGLQSLDARVRVPLVHFGRYSGELVLDGLDLLASDIRLPDTALYQADPSGSIAVDAASRSVSVPLVANPNFGEPTRSVRPGRVFRIGLQLTY